MHWAGLVPMLLERPEATTGSLVGGAGIQASCLQSASPPQVQACWWSGVAPWTASWGAGPLNLWVLVCRVISPLPRAGVTSEWCQSVMGLPAELPVGQEPLSRDSWWGGQVGRGRPRGEETSRARSASEVDGQCPCWPSQPSTDRGRGRGREMALASTFVLREISWRSLPVQLLFWD